MTFEGPIVAINSGLGTEVHGIAASSVRRRRFPWQQRYGFALRLTGCFISVTLAAAFVGFFNHGRAGSSFIWVANGILLAYLLLAPRWRWPAYLCAGFAAMMAGVFLVQGCWHEIDLAYGGLNASEVLIGALLLRRRSSQLPRFTDPRYLLRFIACAVVAAPATIGLIYMLVSVTWLHGAAGDAFLRWAAIDGMGTAVVTPPCVAVFQAGFKTPNSWRRNWIYLALLAAVAITAFAHTNLPILVFTYPLLILVLLELGLGWAALATLCVSAAGGVFALRNGLPLPLFATGSGAGASLRLQTFVVSATLMLYIVSVVLEKQRATERRLRKIAAQHKLVTENSRDVIVLADMEGRRNYVSPAAEILTGWTPEELLTQSSTDLVHPEDMAAVVAARDELGSKTEGSIVECRIRKVNGEYIWVEASLRVVRDPETGMPSGLLNMIRDITERKQAEQKLQEAFRAVETMAVMDALTGLSNRRRFDQCLATEWRRALRDRKPLSMLLIDADLFKSYNDSYGHLCGDSCLKQIAEAALAVVTRPGDLVARFGGEEFAVILPNTGNQGAMLVANDICATMRSRNLSHNCSPFGMVTISVGCATMVPKLGQHAEDLIQMADEALYKVKRGGRNHVCNANTMERIGDKAKAGTLSGAASVQR
jgi:diguanylate cyclase (GGDEF)-like protein/PAS domain S-box-containing protein